MVSVPPVQRGCWIKAGNKRLKVKVVYGLGKSWLAQCKPRLGRLGGYRWVSGGAGPILGSMSNLPGGYLGGPSR